MMAAPSLQMAVNQDEGLEGEEVTQDAEHLQGLPGNGVFHMNDITIGGGNR